MTKANFATLPSPPVTVYAIKWFPCRRVKHWRGRKFVVRKRRGYY